MRGGTCTGTTVAIELYLSRKTLENVILSVIRSLYIMELYLDSESISDPKQDLVT